MECEIFLEDIQNIFDNPKALKYLEESLKKTFKTINNRFVELYSSEKYLVSFMLFYLLESLKTSLEWHSITSMEGDYEEKEDLEEDIF